MHAANALVMGHGGFRFADYLKAGGSLSLLLFIITMALLTLFIGCWLAQFHGLGVG